MSYYEDNFYETEFTDRVPRPEPTCRPLPPQPTPAIEVVVSDPPRKKKPRCGLIIAGAIATVIIVGLLVVLLVQLHVWLPKQQIPEQDDHDPVKNGQSGGEVQSTTKTSARSCLDLKDRGVNVDGISEIKPEDDFGASQTYCDMTTDGGGWTLVASIHENDIKRKCYPDDHWSFYKQMSLFNFQAKSNWENEMTFGNVQRSTTADFKHAGFFAMNASDVMVWHVPNGVPTSLWKEGSTLRYRTNNQFLQSNGGSIGAIYKDKYPLTVTSGNV